MKNITDKYNAAKDNIMAKDAIGKKFGTPKRINIQVMLIYLVLKKCYPPILYQYGNIKVKKTIIQQY